MIKHKDISEGDIVSYNDGEYKVEKVWNHGYHQWWFDLQALKPIIEGMNIFKEEKSVPSYDCVLIRKHSV